MPRFYAIPLTPLPAVPVLGAAVVRRLDCNGFDLRLDLACGHDVRRAAASTAPARAGCFQCWLDGIAEGPARNRCRRAVP